MRKRLLTLTCLLMAAGTTIAAPAKERGAYIGGALAATTFDDGGAFAGFGQDDSDSGFGIFAGYKFFKYFSVEGRYTDFGTFSVDQLPFDASVVSAHAVGIIPFGASGWELFGQLGVGSLEVSFPGVSSESETVGAAGLGLRLAASENFSLGVQLDAYAFEDTSLGASYDVGFAATSLTVKYIF